MTAFTNAVRSFLHQQFADHKFMFGLHMDKAEAGHIHAHAIIAVRSESGPKLNLAPSDLVQLRVKLCGPCPRARPPNCCDARSRTGLSRSYGRRDKAIVDAAANSRSHRMEQDRALCQRSQECQSHPEGAGNGWQSPGPIPCAFR